MRWLVTVVVVDTGLVAVVPTCIAGSQRGVSVFGASLGALGVSWQGGTTVPGECGWGDTGGSAGYQVVGGDWCRPWVYEVAVDGFPCGWIVQGGEVFVVRLLVGRPEFLSGFVEGLAVVAPGGVPVGLAVYTVDIYRVGDLARLHCVVGAAGSFVGAVLC